MSPCFRLAKKKNHNVAVVATARKLVVIAWHMLTKNEPYRYAQPRSTQTKLARLRIKATGARRKGSTKGTKRSPSYGSGVQTLTIKPLAQAYQEEGLPVMGPPPPGEARAIAQTQTEAFVASLEQTQKVPRPQKKKATETETLHAATAN